MSEEIVEKQLGKDPAELESTTEWPVNVIGDEGSMGNQVGLLIDRHEELQPSRPDKESQTVEQLEEVIEEIRRLMVKSTKEAFIKGKLNRGKPA
jgi:hypothetical protein